MTSFTNRDFNPSNHDGVDEIKAAADALAAAVIKWAPEGALRDKALIDTQSASMFAVKAIFS